MLPNSRGGVGVGVQRQLPELGSHAKEPKAKRGGKSCNIHHMPDLTSLECAQLSSSVKSRGQARQHREKDMFFSLLLGYCFL